MLEDLVQVIETIQGRVREHGASLRENETRTRMALIDPLLTALGWDVANPAVVTPEYNVRGRWADYALLGHDDRPLATVEAKKLGESLASHRMQMLNYSNASGVDYAGLTDGNQWELYEVFKRGQLEDRRRFGFNDHGFSRSRMRPAIVVALAAQPGVRPADTSQRTDLGEQRCVYRTTRNF